MHGAASHFSAGTAGYVGRTFLTRNCSATLSRLDGAIKSCGTTPGSLNDTTLPALRLRSGRTAARYFSIICVRFFRARRGKTAHQQQSSTTAPERRRGHVLSGGARWAKGAAEGK